MNNKKNISELKLHIGYRLRVVSNAVSQAFAKSLATNDVTVAEWVILREMYSLENKISPSIIANLTGLTRGAVSKLIDRLLSKGLVIRYESKEDRRYQEIELSKSAIEIIPKLAEIADKNDASFFSILTKAEKNDLMNILVKIAEHHKLYTNPIE